MRLLLLTSLALVVAAPAPAQAVAAHAHSSHTTGNLPARDEAAASVNEVVAGLGQAPRAAEPAVGLSFGDSALPNSPADGHLLGAGGWGSWSGSANDQHNQALSTAGYSSAMVEPAGWAVVAAAVLTLLGLLGLRRRTR